ncbi:MLLT11 transcription factor 7 cofactor [Rhinolophus ferrumequinum]|uniref:Protein AF1q n=1 Tax=Rhinolophus ferrumequinum TaxID=59479 RepID=A0A7J7SYE2_RHIFE|nr:MLLT11 transcription factor 7 cofactor [Rhinolophus ferrumequinum]
MPIPELDLSELESLGLSDTSTYKIDDSSVGKMTGQATGTEEEKNPEEKETGPNWRARWKRIRQRPGRGAS